MSYTPPTLPELIDQTNGDIESRLPGSSARPRRSNLNVLSRVIAGVARGLYGFLSWIYKQAFTQTADEEALRREASLWLKNPYLAGTSASGAVSVSGTNGAVIEADTSVVNDDGVTYSVTEEAIIANGIATVYLIADESGTAGNMVAGEALSFVSPIDGVDSELTVGENGITGGTADETVEELRKRIIERKRYTPMGGAWYDYLRWAKDVQGVTRAWVYSKELGPGTVTIRIMRDKDENPFPAAADVATVQAAIDDQCNVTAEAAVVSPIAYPIDYVIKLKPNTSAVRTAVENQLRNLHYMEATPGGTYTDPDTRLPKQGGILLISHIREAVSRAAGETDHKLVFPTENVVCATGYMPTVGLINFSLLTDEDS